MGTTRKRAQGRSSRTLTAILVLALLAGALLAGASLASGHEGVRASKSAGTSAKPGKPTAKAPKGTINTTKPTFKWSKAPRASRYELRVYKGSKLLLKKTGLAKLSWKSSKALPKNVSLTWKVRASNTRAAGAWSKSLKFKVAVTVHHVGDSYQGGVIAYILQAGDPGYDAQVTHGLIAATADQSTGIRWYNGTNIETGATATALGTGLANTNTIIAAQGAIATSYAAGLARAYGGGGYSDWYLPSKDELNKLYLAGAAIGGLESSVPYWTSSETIGDFAWAQYLNDGSQNDGYKSSLWAVRAVRSF